MEAKPAWGARASSAQLPASCRKALETHGKASIFPQRDAPHCVFKVLGRMPKTAAKDGARSPSFHA